MGQDRDGKCGDHHVPEREVHDERRIAIAGAQIHIEREGDRDAGDGDGVDGLELRPSGIVGADDVALEMAERRAGDPEERPDQRDDLDPSRGLPEQVVRQGAAMAGAGLQLGGRVSGEAGTHMPWQDHFSTRTRPARRARCGRPRGPPRR